MRASVFKPHGLSGARSSCFKPLRAKTAEQPVRSKEKHAFYLLQWQSGSTEGTLGDDLKRLEKVSKEAVWMAAKEGENGKQHVLMVTTDSKTAEKYSLPEVTEATASVLLEGVSEPTVIPVQELRAAIMQEMGSDSSDSDTEMEEQRMSALAKLVMPVTNTNNSETKVVEEDLEAAKHAAALIDGTAPLMGESKGERQTIKQAMKAMEPAFESQKPAPMGMEDSSDSSESESDDEMEQRLEEMEKKMKKLKKSMKEMEEKMEEIEEGMGKKVKKLEKRVEELEKAAVKRTA